MISSGVNSTSQLNTIKILVDNEIDNTIFLIPQLVMRKK